MSHSMWSFSLFHLVSGGDKPVLDDSDCQET